MHQPDWLGEHDDDVLVTDGHRSDRAKTEAWRLEVLLNAGYPATIAERLAVNFTIDLHRAVQLLREGCGPELAAEILL